VSQQPLYIFDRAGPIFATFHPARGPARQEAVVICPPFGWEDMCSYRGRREWASLLAAAGFATLRIDFPGSGDSAGGPRDPERLRAWTDAVGAAAGWLSSTTGVRRILAVGIGLGGAIAYRALASGAPIDDLVLWGVSSRGRRHVRELRAFSYMESSRGEEDATTPGAPDPDDGALVIAGYAMSEETQRELSELDLAELDAPRLASARVLMLERDGQAVDSRLKSAIEERGAQVTVAPGDGYGAMMMVELPHAVSAYGVFDTVSSWLEDLDGSAAGAEDPATGAPGTSAELAAFASGDFAASAELSVPGGGRVRETPITISHPSGDPVGILTEPLGPSADICAVWLNAGPQRRIGPNRMWVETARRWAALGVPTVRIDLAAIGDADGDSSTLLDVRSYYTGSYLEQVRVVLDELQARGLPPRFLLGGLCAGAYWALQIAQEDSRVSAAAVLNPGYLVYDDGLSNAMGQGRRVIPMLLTRSTWARVLRGEITPSAHLAYMRTILKALGRALLRMPSRLLDRTSEAGANEITRAFDRLREQDQRAVILFAGEERLYAQLLATGRLVGLERWPNVSVEHIPLAGDMHTMRPLMLQRAAHRAIDELLRQELER
jgi:alpha-beta hydrolase superfamily lysophospholipase